MANKLGYFDNFINDLTERSGNMLTITGDTTVQTLVMHNPSRFRVTAFMQS